jgi:hypothetical protein
MICFCKATESLQNEMDIQPDLVSSHKHSLENITINDNKTRVESLATFLRIPNVHNDDDNDDKSISNHSVHYFRSNFQHKLSEQNTSGAQVTPPAYEKPKRKLPIAMIIAGPTAAVSVFVFLCLAYYFHNAQLNRNVKRLSMTFTVPQDVISINSNCSSTGMIPPSQRYVHTARFSRDSDILGPRRKSMVLMHTLSIPPSAIGKRGSNWSALADQEILRISVPRRHSTFVL